MVNKKRHRVAAIGTFDGVHRGHRSVLSALKEHSLEHDMEPVAVTFSNHPLSVISPERRPFLLTPLEKKIKLLLEAGANPLVLEFNEGLMKTDARSWLKRLRDEFGIKALVIGYDNTFGCDGVNYSLEDYRRLGEEEGIDVILAPEIKDTSSSAIRKAVEKGDMPKAEEMLGRPYSITARVGHGNKLGHTIGFPTANVDLPEGIAVPPYGVYAAIVKTLEDGKKYPAMVNVGVRPTVMRGDNPVIEAHLINWEGDLYDKEITIRFLERIRDEKKFESIENLRKQLESDKEETLKIYKKR